MIIEIRHFGPTNIKGSRYKAIAIPTGQSLTVPHDYALGNEANEKAAALALASKLAGTDALEVSSIHTNGRTRTQKESRVALVHGTTGHAEMALKAADQW